MVYDIGFTTKNSKFGYPKVMVMSLNFFQIAFPLSQDMIPFPNWGLMNHWVYHWDWDDGLVGGWALPLWNMMELVSWDDDIPNWMEK